MLTAIIPARGGSKRLPRKNLAIVGGIPLVTRAIRLCREVASVVIVSTDDAEIAKTADAESATVHIRSAELCGDDVPAEAVAYHLWKEGAIQTRYAMLYQCTAPLTTVDDLNDVIRSIPSGGMAYLAHKNIGDGPHVWLPSGSAWAFDVDYLQNPWMPWMCGVPVESSSPRLDIDTIDDLDLAKRLLPND